MENPYPSDYDRTTPQYKLWLKEYMKKWREKNKDWIYESYRKKYDVNRYCETCEKEVSVLNNYHNKSKKHLELLNKKKDGYNY